MTLWDAILNCLLNYVGDAVLRVNRTMCWSSHSAAWAV